MDIVPECGTKEKGFICAFSESIFRSHGYSTGFYRYVGKDELIITLNRNNVLLMIYDLYLL